MIRLGDGLVDRALRGVRLVDLGLDLGRILRLAAARPRLRPAPARFFASRSTWTPIEMKKATSASTIADEQQAGERAEQRGPRRGRRRSPGVRRPAWRSRPARPCSARSPWTQVTRPKRGLTPVWRSVTRSTPPSASRCAKTTSGWSCSVCRYLAPNRVLGSGAASSSRASASAASMASVSASARAPSSLAISSESRVSQPKRASATAACSSALALIRPSSRSTWIRCAPSRQRCSSSRAARARVMSVVVVIRPL